MASRRVEVLAESALEFFGDRAFSNGIHSRGSSRMIVRRQLSIRRRNEGDDGE